MFELLNPRIDLYLRQYPTVCSTKNKQWCWGARMPRYNSRRHRKLMDESEYALQSAADSSSLRVSRVVNTVLGDNRIYALWESRHANLMLPVAEHSGKRGQIVALRNAEVQLVHQREIGRASCRERV